MLAKLPGHIRVRSTDDITEKFLLLHNSFDGSSSLRVHFTPIRVVCQNTLAVAETRGRGQGIRIVHRGELETKVQEARRVLGLADKFYADLQPKIDLLAGYYPTHDQLQQFFRTLYPDPVDGISTRAENVRGELFRLFEEGVGQDIPGIRHSAWAALHAVTEYVDHCRTTRGRSDFDRTSKRLQSLWFGSGAQLKQRAWDLALAMAS